MTNKKGEPYHEKKKSKRFHACGNHDCRRDHRLIGGHCDPQSAQSQAFGQRSFAQGTLRTLSTAAETFATANNGNYPTSEAVLTGATPPYINQAYCGTTSSGYVFSCPTMTAGAYSFIATPVTDGTTGTSVYTMRTGGVLTSAP